MDDILHSSRCARTIFEAIFTVELLLKTHIYYLITNISRIFVDNRIDASMLINVDKALLNEMGITAIGDVIRILRHAATCINIVMLFIVVYDKYVCVGLCTSTDGTCEC
jgi:hypothetical protein